MSKDDAKNKADDIKVNDKRRFAEDGAAKDGEVSDGKHEVEKEESAGSEKETGDTNSLPEIDFPTFILSLATSAQVHLGVIANPATGKQEVDLPLAKQTIDILGVMQDKTKGNLSEEEERLLEHLLYDLRMMYVEKGK